MRNFTCHSGGAVGADQCFEEIALQYNCQVINYSYRTLHHKIINKYELTNEEFLEGCKAVEVVAEQLKRYRYKPYINLLARNFFQTKFAKQLFAVGILRSDQNGVLVELEGGTGWSVQMAINMKREIYVFDQNRCKWFAWSYTKKQFEEYENPVISQEHFAGIGTRKINIFGIQAIRELFERSFNSKKNE